ncbi:MAG: c-type cytochrome biogenesis protein CcsB, partial [Deltaproteobacteria bacterium]|nr:c-type cytochrome biogenesis protein CcsB [Deltaproteobacteria bacterium]
MISTKMFSSVTFLYLACTVLYFNFLAFRSEQLGKVATALSWATLLIHTAAILWRWVESYQLGMGHAPLSNMYESLVFFSWCIALLYLLWEWKLKSRVVGAFAMPFAFLTIAYASLAGVPDRIDP